MQRLAHLFAAVVIASAALSCAETSAALTYYFNWYCPGCSRVGSGSSGREGPFGSHAACEAARAAMGGSLYQRGCGPDCFYPRLCQFEGTPDAPPAARQAPGYPPPSIHTPPVPDYEVSGRRRAQEAQRDREQAQRGAQTRSAGETTPATPPELAERWRNAVSRYEARKSGQTLEFVLVETCATADCSRKNYPNRPVFRGTLDGGRFIGVVLIHAAVESWQGNTRCSTAAGEFPIKGKLSADGRSITWEKAEFPVQGECRAPALSLGTWQREP